ncbi:efflux RND transporter permease subunit [Gemmatimonas sp.]|uniref:efflux RND transporter permease subunit n=1 Tax=Gemmatimonas sp. TaxID=1962908 RepID=UPI0037BF8733
MIRAVIRAAVHRPAVMWALAVALLLAGGIACMRVPLATRTTVELPRLAVSAYWPGASPDVIETYLTAPIERAVQGVRGVKRVNSTSVDDLAMLEVHLEPRADGQLTRLAMLERLALLRTALPPGADAPQVATYVPDGMEEAPLLSLAVSGSYTQGTLQRLLVERVQPRLASVAGVAGVRGIGGAAPGVTISYAANRLRQLGIPPERLAQAVGSARLVQSLGALHGVGTVRAVVLRDQPAALDSLAYLPVMGAGGQRFWLGELATVRAEEDTRGRFYRINGRSAVALDITRHPGADAISTAAALRREVSRVQSVLPVGVQLRITADESEGLSRDLRDFAERGVVAFGAVLVVLALLLRNARAVVLVMGTTVVAIGGTALTLYLLHIPVTLLSLAGLGMGVGILVQNAIVVAERLMVSRNAADARATAARRIAPAVLGSTLTTAVVLLPFLYLQGNARAAFAPFAMAFVIALAWSVFTALVMLPALARGVGTAGHSTPVQPIRDPLRGSAALRASGRRVYARTVIATLRWRHVTRSAALALVVGVTWLFVATVPRNSFGRWGDRRSTLSVGLTFPSGSDPATLDATMRAFEQIAVGRRGVEEVRSSGGGSSAQMHVRFTRSGGTGRDPLVLQALLTQRAVLVGGASVYVSGDGPAFSNGGGNASVSTFRLQVKGFAYDRVARLAADVAKRLERMPRVREVRITSGGWFGRERTSQVVLEPDRAALARHGLTAAHYVAAVAREVRGPVGRQRIEIGGEELPVTVKGIGANARTLGELQQALIPSSASTVRVGHVSMVAERDAPGSVVREDQQYLREVRYEFRGPARLARRTHASLMQSLAAPAGYLFTDLSEGSDFGNDGSERGLWLVFALGVALVVLSVALVFDSVWGAFMVLLSLPLALTGVLAAFALTGTAFTREAAVGGILVVGLAVNQAILLVDAALESRRRAWRLSGWHVARAALDRAGMITTVTLAALASLVPLSVGTPTDTLFGSVALATAGGTIAGTLGVLLVMPALMLGRAGPG